MNNYQTIFMSLFLIALFSASPLSASVSRTIAHTQEKMSGSRSHSLGNTNPVLIGDINASLINPASLNSVDTMPFSFSQLTIMGEFDYNVLSLSYPFDIPLSFLNARLKKQRISLGLNYGSVALNQIPQTILLNNEIWQVDSFKGGFQLVDFTSGTSFYDVFGLNAISLGTGLKFISSQISSFKAAGYGLDIGVIGSRFIDYHQLNSLHAGLAFHNILSSPIRYNSSNNKGILPTKAYLGLRADLYSDMLSLFLNNDQNGINLGAEYQLQENIVLRGSRASSSYNAGVGIIFDRISSGFSANDYTMRLDYNYQYNAYPFHKEPSHSFTFSILGNARPKPPLILSPYAEQLIINEPTIMLSGVGPKNTALQVYNNDTLARSTLTSKFGTWKIPRLDLNQGRNDLHIIAFDVTKELSNKSNVVTVFSDLISPTFNVNIKPKNNTYIVSVTANEQLDWLTGKIDNMALTFTQTNPQSQFKPVNPLLPSHWVSEFTAPDHLKNHAYLPKEMSMLYFQGSDLASNQSQLLQFPFFLQMDYPKDKHVHYKKTIRCIGSISPLISQLSINDHRIYIDQDLNFSISLELEAGKNLIPIQLTPTEGDDIYSYIRILRLKTFPDLTRRTKGKREIEFLATLGVLDSDFDNLFHPKKVVTRDYITKLMVLLMGETELKNPEYDLFFDVPKDHPYAPYILVAIDQGLMFAFPDGTFKPDQGLTLTEVVMMLVNAGIIDDVEVEEEAEGEYLTRAGLAEFLAYTPSYELKIERLINWEAGYDRPTQ